MTEARGVSTFRAATDMYGRFVGRYAPELAAALIEATGIEHEDRVLDVGCGPGGLATALAKVVGSENVAAVDPSSAFVSVCRARLPSADVRLAAAEELPFENDSFDAALAQLVVNFMTDAERGVGEMKRVVKPGGKVAACTWDYRDGMTMLRAFWDAAHESAPDEAARLDEGLTMGYSTEEELTGLWRQVGLEDVRGGELSVTARLRRLRRPVGAVAQRDRPGRCLLRVARAGAPGGPARGLCATRLGNPEGPFELSARAWYAVGRVS